MDQYLCNFNVINLKICVWMWLLSVEHLLYCDGSKRVFAVCALQISEHIHRVRYKLAAHLPCPALASLLGPPHKASSICAALSSIRRGCITTTVTCETCYPTK